MLEIRLCQEGIWKTTGDLFTWWNLVGFCTIVGHPSVEDDSDNRVLPFWRYLNCISSEKVCVFIHVYEWWKRLSWFRGNLSQKYPFSFCMGGSCKIQNQIKNGIIGRILHKPLRGFSSTLHGWEQHESEEGLGRCLKCFKYTFLSWWKDVSKKAVWRHLPALKLVVRLV